MPIAHEQISVVIDGRSIVEAYTRRRLLHDLVIRHPQGRVKMNDWHEAFTLAAKSDGEIFDRIVKGKGKMTGEADRISAEMAWKLVNYVRSFTKNETSPIPKIGASR